MKIKQIIAFIIDALIDELSSIYGINAKRRGLKIYMEDYSTLFEAHYRYDVHINKNNINKLINYIKAMQKFKKINLKNLKITFDLYKFDWNEAKQNNVKSTKSITCKFTELPGVLNYDTWLIGGLYIISEKPIKGKIIDVSDLLDNIDLNKNVKEIQEFINVLHEQEFVAQLVAEIVQASYSEGAWSTEVEWYDFSSNSNKKLFKPNNSSNWDIVIDNNYILEPEENYEAYVDGRVSYVTEYGLDHFWNNTYTETLPHNIYNDGFPLLYNVAHYKGKDWYVCSVIDYERKHYPYTINKFDINNNYIEFATNELCIIKYLYDYTFSFANSVASGLLAIKNELELKGYCALLYEPNKVNSILNNQMHLINKVKNKNPIYIYNYLTEHSVDLSHAIIAYIINKEGYDKYIEYNTNTIMSIISPSISTDNLDIEKIFSVYASHYLLEEQGPSLFYLYKLLKKKFKKMYVDILDHTLCFIIKDKFDYHINAKDLYILLIHDAVDDYYLKVMFKAAIYGLAEKIIYAINKRRKELIKNKEIIKKAQTVFVSVEDSITAGNCPHGTQKFCKVHGIDTTKVGAVRGDVILKWELSSYTLRAVNQAIKRYEKNNR